MTLKNTLLFLMFLPIMLCAQRNDQHTALVVGKLYPNEAVETYDLRKRKEIKRVFFNDNWLEGKFLFSSEDDIAQRTFPLKYDILNQELSIDLGGSIYAVPLDSIHGFVMDNSLSTTDYEFMIRPSRNEKPAVIFEVVIKGEYKLLIHHFAKKVKANYQPALDAGDRDEKVTKKQAFYLIDGHGRLVEIPKKKKEAEKLFSKYAPAKKYLTKNKVNFKNKNSLKKLFLFMNNYQKK